MWNWLLEKEFNGEFLSDYVRKISQTRVVICLWCKETLNYSSFGKKRINLGAWQNKEKHLKNEEMFLKNITTPASWKDLNKVV